MKNLERQNHNGHDELKKDYENKKYDNETKKMDNDHFDVNVFNKIYEENRMEDIYDNGYGDWFKKDKGEGEQKKMFQGKFNKDLFNNEFDKYKNSNKKKDELALREPTEEISYKGSDSEIL